MQTLFWDPQTRTPYYQMLRCSIVSKSLTYCDRVCCRELVPSRCRRCTEHQDPTEGPTQQGAAGQGESQAASVWGEPEEP